MSAGPDWISSLDSVYDIEATAPRTCFQKDYPGKIALIGRGRCFSRCSRTGSSWSSTAR